MAEYIDRGTAIAKLTALEVTEPNATMADAKRVLADIPAADVAQVVHERWEEYLIPNILCCSNSDWCIDLLCKSPYCPNCGAKMNEKEVSMIKPYIKNETAVDIICSICDRMYPGMDCEPADCEWMKMLAEEAVDAVPVVRCKDCEYSYDEISYLCCSHGVCVDCEVPTNFYCAYGKRRAEKEPPEEGET